MRHKGASAPFPEEPMKKDVAYLCIVILVCLAIWGMSMYFISKILNVDLVKKEPNRWEQLSDQLDREKEQHLKEVLRESNHNRPGEEANFGR